MSTDLNLPFSIHHGEDYTALYDSKNNSLFGEIQVDEKVINFIVLACNEYYENKRKADSHYELLEFAQDEVAHIRAEFMHRDFITDSGKWLNWLLEDYTLMHKRYLKAKAAIAKAEGK